MKQTIRFIVAMVFIHINMVTAQQDNSEFTLPEITRPSPTVAQLMKFEEVDVSYYTGQPNINIPLFSKNIHGLNYNLALQYQVSGIRVDEQSGWVGKGWALETGGVISRSVVGLPDNIDIANEFLGSDYNGFHDHQSYSQNSYDLHNFLFNAQHANQQRFDYQRDVYQFNFFGHTGRFVFIKDGGVLKPKIIGDDSKLKITATYVTGNLYYPDVISKFEVTDTNGFVYTFDVVEETEKIAYSVAVPQAGSGGISPNISEDWRWYRSAWKLSKVETHNRLPILSISYTPITETPSYPGSLVTNYVPALNSITGNTTQCTQSKRNALLPRSISSSSSVEIKSQKVNEIVFNDGVKLMFGLRTTGHPEYDGAVLGSLSIFDPTDISSTNTFSFTYNNYMENAKDLLFLEEIKKNNSTTHKYTLEYINEEDLSAYDQNISDDFGYYNSGNEQTAHLDVTSGALESITYPTGGHRKFNWESNTYSFKGDRLLTHEEIKANPDNYVINQIAPTHVTSTNNVPSTHLGSPFSVNGDDYDVNVKCHIISGQIYIEPYHFIVEYGLNGSNTVSGSFPVTSATTTSAPDGISFPLATGSYWFRINRSPFSSPLPPFENDYSNYNVEIRLTITSKNLKKGKLHWFLHGGGPRISSIEAVEDGNTKTKTRYNYALETDILSPPMILLDHYYSSGSFDGDANLIREYEKRVRPIYNISGTPNDPVLYQVKEYQNTLAAQMTQGNFIGYKTVAAHKQDVNNSTQLFYGEVTSNRPVTKYIFDSPLDTPTFPENYDYPFDPIKDTDYKRGNLTTQLVYNDNNQLIQKTENTYNYQQPGANIENNVAQTLYFSVDDNILANNLHAQIKRTLYDNYDDYLNNDASADVRLQYEYQCSGLLSSYLSSLATNYPNSMATVSPLTIGVANYMDEFYYKVLLTETETTNYYYEDTQDTSGEAVEIRQAYSYVPENYQVSEKNIYYKEKGVDEHYQTKYYYPVSPGGYGVGSALTLTSQNKIDAIIATEQFKNSDRMFTTVNRYATFDVGNPGISSDDLIQIEKIQSLKGEGNPPNDGSPWTILVDMEDRIVFEDYDDYGNPLEVRKADGTSISYIWGYNRTLPLAKVVNASRSDIDGLLGGDFHAGTGALTGLEIDDLKTGLLNAHISIYDYSLINGITKEIDVRGYTMNYEYDDFNRLEYIKDQDGYLLNKYEYILGSPSHVKTTAYQVETTDGVVKAESLAPLQDDDKIESITYLDGLGRAEQSIIKQAGGNRQDIITPVVYDGYGRQAQEYLPYANASQAFGTANLNFRTMSTLLGDLELYYANKYSDDQISTNTINAYSEQHFETSPLNRVLEQAAPGNDWLLNTSADTDHTIKLDYQANSFNSGNPTDPTKDNVLRFTVSFNGGNTIDPVLGFDNNYSSNELHKTITKDENWQPGQTLAQLYTTEEFKDALGRVVLKRTFSEDNSALITHDTYYAYDDFGNLTYVLPPKVSDSGTLPTSTELDQLCYQYRYDQRNRLIEKKIPGKGWEYIVYDKLDRPVLTQDAKLRISKQWLFTKYDAFDRVAFTGLHSYNLSRNDLQGVLDGETVMHEVRSNRGITIDGKRIYYKNVAYPTSDIYELHIVNYYDDYIWDTLNNYGASYEMDLSLGLSQLDNVISKVASGSWNAGFTSAKTIASDGYIQWKVTQSDKRVMVGLSETTSTQGNGYVSIDYAIYTGSGTDSRVFVYEKGVFQNIAVTNFVPGDIFKVERIGNTIYYKHNNEVFHISAVTTTETLIGDSSFLDTTTAIEDVHIGFSGCGQNYAQDVTGLPTGSKIRTLETTDWTHNETYYDVKGRPVTTASKNEYLEKSDIVTSLLDFNGKVIKTFSSHIDDAGGKSAVPVNTLDKFTYDHTGRMLRQTQIINDNHEELILNHFYDEVGQLHKKSVGGPLVTDTDYVNVSAGITLIDNTIEKTTANGWNEGLSTLQSIIGDGYVEFTPVTTYKSYMVGLNYNDPNTHYNNIDYTIYVLWNGSVKIYENGSDKGIKSLSAPGDVFRVERRGTVVRYYKNGEPFYTSEAEATTAPLYGDISLHHQNSKIKDFRLVNLNNPLQDVDYTYNIRGWLKTINDLNSLGNDLFGFQLNYNTTELGQNNTTLFNGNISETLWNTQSVDAATLEQEIKRGYAYSYDALNRITDANFIKDSGVNHNNQYDLTDVSYDRNGNILTLRRSGHNGLSPVSNMDNLLYQYQGNQLTNVEENGDNNLGFTQVTTQTTDYAYDVNGNMTEDKNKAITSIEYNHLNLPVKVVFHNLQARRIEYTYDATGVKQDKKVYNTHTPLTITSYAGNFIYEYIDNISQPGTGDNVLKMFSHPEGYVDVSEEIGDTGPPFYFPTSTQVYDYVYNYKDHLGNIRLNYAKDEVASTLADDDFTTNTSDWSSNGSSVVINNNNSKLNVSITPRWNSTSKYRDVIPGVPVHIEFDFEKGDMDVTVFFVKERINGVWESNADRDRYVLQDGHFEADLSFTGDHIRLYFEKGTGSDDGVSTTCHVDNFRVFQNRLEIIEENNYYPFGLKHKGYNNVVNANVNSVAQKYKYNGKELNNELGLDWYDYGARNYDASLGRWMNLDPLAEQMRRHSPYNYAFNNPLRFIDPDGMAPDDVIITGTESLKAFDELQASVQGQLTLSQDANGKVTYTINQDQNGNNVALNSDTQQLVDAIDDGSITVNIDAQNDNYNSDNSLRVGGSFMGNTVTQDAQGNNTVTANQEINPNVLENFSDANGNPGADTLHEVTEAYQGAKISQASGVSSPNAGQPGSVYPTAHQAATPPSGVITEHVVYENSNGGPGITMPIQRIGGNPVFSGTVYSLQWKSNNRTIQTQRF